MVLAVDLRRVFTDGPVPLVLGRLTDVAVRGALAVVGMLIAGAWHRSALAKGLIPTMGRNAQRRSPQ